MATLAKLVVKLVGDISDYEQAMKTAEGKAKAVGDKLKGVGTKMTAGLTLPLVGLGLVAVNSASDLEESLSKVNVVFGDNADAIIEWSESSATSMGQSQSQALEAVGTYGNLLQAIGIIPDQAADMSKSFVELASDLASFNNASPEETLLALRSALTGEFEPMKRFGVALNQAAIKEKAVAMGLVDIGEELTPAIKAQAGYALILEQTSMAHGDFERTSDGLANSTRILKSQFADTAATIGQQLLPIAMEIVNVIRGWLEKFQAISPPMQKVIIIVLAIVAAIGPLLLIVGSLIGAFGSIIGIMPVVVAFISPILPIILAVIAVVALLAAAWKNNWGDIQGKVKAAIEFIRNLIQTALDWIKSFWDQHGAKITATIQGIWDGIKAIFDWFVGIAKEIFEAFQLAFSGDWEGFGSKLREIWDRVWNDIKEALGKAWEWIKDMVAKGIDAIIKFFTETDWLELGTNLVKSIADGISAAVKWVIDAIVAVAKAIWGALIGFFTGGSPLKLMIGFGENVMSSWAKGIDQTAHLPDMAMGRAVTGFGQDAGLQVGAGAGAAGAGLQTVGAGTAAPLIVYGGLHLHGVEDKQSLLDELRDLMP